MDNQKENWLDLFDSLLEWEPQIYNDEYYICSPCSEDGTQCQVENSLKIDANLIEDLHSEDGSEDNLLWRYEPLSKGSPITIHHLARKQKRHNDATVFGTELDMLCEEAPTVMVLQCNGPCINQLPKPDCSSKNKRVKIVDRRTCTKEVNDGGLLGQNYCEKGKENDGTKAGSQVATETKTKTTENAKECYFERERLNPDGLEKKERPAQSKVSNECCGELRSFEELANSEPVPDLLGGENNADLALIRGAAEFGNNFDDEAVKERMKNIYICKKHEDELVFRWKSSSSPRHIFYKRSRHGQKPACTVPNVLLNKHASNSVHILAKAGAFLRKKQAQAFLQETGAHLQVGIPMCQAHAEHIDRWQIAHALDEDGLQVAPDIDYAGTSNIEGSRSVYSEYSSLQSTYCASGSSSQSEGYLPPPERYRTTATEIDPTITEGMKSTLRAFLKEIGIERLFSIKEFSQLKVDTLRKKGDSCRRMRQTVYKIVAPGHEDVLEEMDCKRDSNGVWTTRSSRKLQSVMEAIAQRYAESAEWPDRRAVLAIIAPILSFAELEKFIPGLTPYRYTMARNHARGMSKPIPERGAGIRNRYSPGRVREFVAFITSDAVMIGLPYGSISAKTSSGTKIEIDSTLRRHRNEHITQLYERYLEGVYGPDHEMGISRSSMWQILQTCSAHRKKAITGLDEFIANGRDGFDYIYQMLQNMLDRNYEDRDFVDMATKRLRESHQYLESDFKLHVKGVSRVADHCIRYALSDPDDDKFSTPCEAEAMPDSHRHDMVCDRCEQLKSILGEIRIHVFDYPLPPNEKDRFKGKYLAAEKAIMDMRRHQIRSVLSSTTRKKYVEQLGSEGYADTLVTLDWAMKWLPTKGRETQTDFFGKRGISWHIAHALHSGPNKDLTQRTLVHIINDDLQDSDAVLAILRNVLEDLKNFGVKRIILQSDNAGCYHSSKTLAAIKKISEETGVFIMRYTFFEAQSGKSSCDRMAAVVKRKLRDYIDQGNDVTNCDDFLRAMKTATKINGMQFVTATVKRPKKSKKTPAIPKITFLSDITFYEDGIQAKKYAGIGTGMKIEDQHWKGKESNVRLHIIGRYPGGYNLNGREYTEWSPLHCTRHLVTRWNPSGHWGAEQNCEEEETEEEQQISHEKDTTGASDIIDDDDALKNEETEVYYDCPEPNCIAQFSKLGNLQRHIITGKHKFALERKTMRDFALHNFQINIAGDAENRIRLQEPVEEIVNDLKLIDGQEHILPLKGWAMKDGRVSHRFSGKQKAYLDAAFNKGVKKRSEKVDANQLAVQMEKAVEGETTNPLFNFNELLSAKQIANYFGLKARRMRQQQPDCITDPEADICSTIDGQHESSEGEEELENAEDPMFYNAEDEVDELVEETGIIDSSQASP